jgi:hypothetical protein
MSTTLFLGERGKSIDAGTSPIVESDAASSLVMIHGVAEKGAVSSSRGVDLAK